MTIHNITSLLFLVTILLGCKPSKPTSIATLNNSARELVGTFSIGREQAPFANESIHSGNCNLLGGETVNVTLSDLWTENDFHFTSIVPPRPENYQDNLLLISIDPKMQLKLTWKNENHSLQDIRLNYLLEQTKCTPIIINNSGMRTDYIVRIKQGPYSSICDRSYQDSTDRFYNYGLVFFDNSATDGLVIISYGPGIYTKTAVAEIPKTAMTPTPKSNTLYLHIDQENHQAILYTYQCETSNPRLVAQQLQQTITPELTQVAELKLRIITHHFNRKNFSIPNLSNIEPSAP